MKNSDLSGKKIMTLNRLDQAQDIISELKDRILEIICSEDEKENS